MVCRVFRENTFTAATLMVIPGQKVISSGPYSLVRHAIDASALTLLLGTPVARGSWRGWLLWPPMACTIAWRGYEESVLFNRLPGYPQYCQTVPHRLIPWVW